MLLDSSITQPFIQDFLQGALRESDFGAPFVPPLLARLRNGKKRQLSLFMSRLSCHCALLLFTESLIHSDGNERAGWMRQPRGCSLTNMGDLGVQWVGAAHIWEGEAHLYAPHGYGSAITYDSLQKVVYCI